MNHSDEIETPSGSLVGTIGTRGYVRPATDQFCSWLFGKVEIKVLGMTEQGEDRRESSVGETKQRTLGAALPRWKCYKEVRAFKIAAIESRNEGWWRLGGQDVRIWADVPQAWMDKHKPEVGGYYVWYADDYRSYSPAKAFEEGYMAISGDWRERVKEEKRQLDIYLDRLTEALKDHPKHGISAVALDLLREQHRIMTRYSEVLAQRLAI
jgi:hypothetical protein